MDTLWARGTKISLDFAANFFNNAIAQQDFHLHFPYQVIPLFNPEEPFNGALGHFLVHLQQLHLLKLLQGLVLALEQLAFTLVDLGLKVADLLGDRRIIGVGRLLLHFGHHALTLHFNLLQLTVKLIDLGLELLLNLLLPAGSHDDFDVNRTFEQEMRL